MSELSYLSLTKIRDMLRAKGNQRPGNRSSSLDRIEATEPKCNAMVTVLGEQAWNRPKNWTARGPMPPSRSGAFPWASRI